jgi:hypothetical protein
MSCCRVREEPDIRHTGKYWLGLCVLFFLASLFSENFIINHAAHDCCGEGCPVCMQIQGGGIFLRNLRNFSSQSSFFPDAMLLLVIILKFAVLSYIPVSSVSLKVKLNR